MESETNYWVYFAFMLPFGLIVFTGGLLLYTKKFVGLLVLDSFMPGKPSLAQTYIGAWLLLMAPSEFVLQSDIDALIVPYSFVLLGCLALGLLGCFWMPKFLQPKWMKEGDKLEARGKDPFTKRFYNGES
ncbi:hypothetical protein [Arthrobacter koreensis]|uniref:hypothetical protein n=1 Tax=Arthrobacter koreensis TaxID=199136 RepID=UPI002DBE3426|nr:hypothetical protein [Arthrobacter koreensis]MEB7503569.1 hypothetical protein [Arthrobacter koreensis]